MQTRITITIEHDDPLPVDAEDIIMERLRQLDRLVDEYEVRVEVTSLSV